LDELCQDEDWVDEAWIDIAAQRLKSGLYSDYVVGRSLRAVRADHLLNYRRNSYSDVAPIGQSTLTAGLLQFVPGDPTRLEPMAHFGHLAMVPVGTVQGAWGPMAAYLVESSASRGMSGAPVFTKLDSGEYRLLGVHVGHFKENQVNPGDGEAMQNADGQGARAHVTSTETEAAQQAELAFEVADSDVRDFGPSTAMHSQVGLVAPAHKLLQILNTQSARDSRAEVEAAVQRDGWRLLDSSYRQQAGVCWPEVLYESLDEFESSHPYDRHFLILRPTDELWLLERQAGEGIEPWSEVEVGPLGTVGDVVDVLQSVTGLASPIRNSSDGILLCMTDETYDVTLHLDEMKKVEAVEMTFRVIGADTSGVYGLARKLNGIVQDVRRL
jgi:hypothetical protein